MMKKLATVSLALLIAGVLAAPVVAGEKTVTLEGTVICAKCTLKQTEFEDCQNVLVVKNDGKKEHYYLAKNETNTEFGDVCMVEKQVRVTGSVSKKDGRLWIAATDITPTKSEG